MADVAASVLARLKNKAAKSGRSYQLCLQLFCQEEFYALLWCQSVEQQRGVILLSPFRREKTFVVCQCTFDCTSEIIVQSIGCSLGIF